MCEAVFLIQIFIKWFWDTSVLRVLFVCDEIKLFLGGLVDILAAADEPEHFTSNEVWTLLSCRGAVCYQRPTY